MISPLELALANPETTKAKKERTPIAPPDIRQRMDERGRQFRGKKRELVIPGLDVAALNAKYGMAHANDPKPHGMTFRCRVGGTPEEYRRRYEQAKFTALKRWIDWERKNGWELIPSLRIQIMPWVFPAVDLLDGQPLSDQREFRVQAYFYLNYSRVQRMVLPPEITKPVTFVR